LIQRKTLVELRARSVIGDDAFHMVEEEIDLLELSADERIRPPSVAELHGSPEEESS
jgi:CPA1 family monovalent cation:H+ antiporter